MNSETVWGPALGVLAGGLLLGAIAAWRLRQKSRVVVTGASKEGQRSAAEQSSSQEMALSDLKLRKQQLLTRLRELSETPDTEGAQEERRLLEREAAEVFRQLDAFGPTVAAGDLSQPASMGSRGLLSPELRGALKGGLLVGVICLIALALWQGTRPRSEGMGITGNDPNSSAPEDPPQSTSGAGAARPIVARETPRFVRARARLARQPDETAALVEYGYAAAEAGGWIDVFKSAQKLLAQDANNVDGRIQLAMVRAVMGRVDAAAQMLDAVLKTEPSNLRALELRGRVAMRAGDRKTALEIWRRGQAQGDTEGIFTRLIALANETRPRVTSEKPLPPDHPPLSGEDKGAVAKTGSAPRAADVPQNDATSGTQDAISGTIELGPDVTPPQGGTIFVFARAPGAAGGPPLAAKRLAVSSFPLPFRLTQSDSMLGAKLPPEISLNARLDSDGNAMTRSADDLVATPLERIPLGSATVKLILSPRNRASD